jgi:hypothetical protein
MSARYWNNEGNSGRRRNECEHIYPLIELLQIPTTNTIFTMTVSTHTPDSLSKSNKHCVLIGKESVRIEERPIPECGPGQVLVYIMATGM